MVRVGGAVGREGMTLFGDPDAVTVSEWDIHPDAHPCIALSAVSYDTQRQENNAQPMDSTPSALCVHVGTLLPMVLP